MSFTEDDKNEIRQIIREEMKQLFKDVAKMANDENNQDISESESSALFAIEEVSKRVAERLPHAWNCDKRKRWSWMNKCSCGVEVPYLPTHERCPKCKELVPIDEKVHHPKYCLGE